MNETYEVRPCVTDGAQGVEECQGDDIPGFWGVYLRTTTAEWVADFLHEDDARAYADMKNGVVASNHIIGLGNPIDGLSFVGPFIDRDKAIEYAEGFIGKDWWVADLLPKEES